MGAGAVGTVSNFLNHVAWLVLELLVFCATVLADMAWFVALAIVTAAYLFGVDASWRQVQAIVSVHSWWWLGAASGALFVSLIQRALFPVGGVGALRRERDPEPEDRSAVLEPAAVGWRIEPRL